MMSFLEGSAPALPKNSVFGKFGKNHALFHESRFTLYALRFTHHASQVLSKCTISSTLVVATPTFLTTAAAATVAISAASTNWQPATKPRVNAARKVSPAPATS
jgi:hypothetical protein